MTMGGRPYRWRMKLSKLTSIDIRSVMKFGGGGILVVGNMCWGGLTGLKWVKENVKAAQYCDATEFILQAVANIRGVNLEKSYYLHNNDPKHCSKLAQEIFKRLNIKLIKLPPQSTDLNPIEHAWAELKR